mgnify:CR=1 FL=1
MRVQIIAKKLVSVDSVDFFYTEVRGLGDGFNRETLFLEAFDHTVCSVGFANGARTIPADHTEMMHLHVITT